MLYPIIPLCITTKTIGIKMKQKTPTTLGQFILAIAAYGKSVISSMNHLRTVNTVEPMGR